MPVNFQGVIWPYEGKLAERGGDPKEPGASTPLAKYFLPVDKCQHRTPQGEGGYSAAHLALWGVRQRRANPRLARRRFWGCHSPG